MKVESREYKLMVQPGPFSIREETVKDLWVEIDEILKTLGVRGKGEFEEKESRVVCFIDTPDHTLRQNRLIFRQRQTDKSLEYTLKCRSEDRYVVAGTEVGPREKGKSKLEEDIAPPFRCRFSHSASIEFPRDESNPGPHPPLNLKSAAVLFPLLGTLRADGRACAPETSLSLVNHIVVDEEVWKGPRIVFDDRDGQSTKATVALILWSRQKRRQVVAAELSFRIKDEEERFSRPVAEAARAVYETMQRLDLARQDGMTKTEYVYRDASTD